MELAVPYHICHFHNTHINLHLQIFLCNYKVYFQGLLLDVVELVDSLLLELAAEERLETLELIRPTMR